MNYSSLAFSNAAKQLQEKAGSRISYARMEKQEQTEVLTETEFEFISQRDGFYMATIGENGFPYIQFRGGPKGFIKQVDEKTLGFIDFKGNKQFISSGNLLTNKKAALFFMDYAAQTRLKIFAEAELLELKDNPQLFNKLNFTGYNFKPEQMIVLHIRAYNWNCPQHITPRYTLEEIEEAYAEQRNYIASLEAEIALLKSLKA